MISEARRGEKNADALRSELVSIPNRYPNLSFTSTISDCLRTHNLTDRIRQERQPTLFYLPYSSEYVEEVQRSRTISQPDQCSVVRTSY